METNLRQYNTGIVDHVMGPLESGQQDPPRDLSLLIPTFEFSDPEEFIDHLWRCKRGSRQDYSNNNLKV